MISRLKMYVSLELDKKYHTCNTAQRFQFLSVLLSNFISLYTWQRDEVVK